MTPEDALSAIVRTLGGRRSGRAFSCHCPIHGDRHASLSVGIGRTGQVLVHCHAGCDPQAIIADLRQRRLWPDRPSDPAKAARRIADADAYRRQRHREAAQIWAELVPLALTPGAHYLRHWRAIDAPLGPRLRWHWQRFALVALITDGITDTPIGVQVTPLARTTDQRDGDRHFIGQSAGGVIRLVDEPGTLVLGEGVETTLSGFSLTKADAAWCALSADNLAQLRVPLGIMQIGLLVDRDRAGETAARWAARRLHTADPRRCITLHRPVPPHGDFNDVARRSRGLP